MSAIFKTKLSLLTAFVLVAVTAAMPVVFETLNVNALLDMNQAFGYSNTLFTAIAGVVYLVIGFAIAKMVIRFVIDAVTRFSF